MAYSEPNVPMGAEKTTLTWVVSEVVELAQRLLSKVSGNPPGTISGEAELSPASVVDSNIQVLKGVTKILRKVDSKLAL